MSKMKVGDIGVLQHIIKPKYTYFNGCIAKIIPLSPLNGSVNSWSVEIYGFEKIISKGKYRGTAAIYKYQIRPISDPDAEQETEKVKELVE